MTIILSEKEAVALVKCPECGAEPGSPCSTKSDENPTQLGSAHEARKKPLTFSCVAEFPRFIQFLQLCEKS